MSPEDLLRQNGITLKSFAPGRHYTTCPQCSRDRSTASNRKAECLGVTIEADDSVRWGCNHCSWTGPQPGDGKRNGNGGDGAPLLSYVYRDKGGVAQFRKVRNPPGSRQRFFIQRWTGADWQNGAGRADTSILYRADDVARAIAEGRVILCVEGEKDADNCWRVGFAATCNAHGASDPIKNQRPKWTAKHSAQLAGADIVVLNDNDPPGYDHAETTCRLSAGVATRVRRLDLKDAWPDIPKGGDVSDWLGQGHTRAELEELIASAPGWTPSAGRPKPTERTAWFAELRIGERGKVIGDLRNVLIAVRAEPLLADAFAFDDFAQDAILQTPTPLAPGALAPPPPPRPIADDDVSRLQEWLQHCGLPRVGRETVAQAVDVRARERRFHPIREWLDRLEWDNEPRIGAWLHRYLGAPDDEYHRQVGSMFLIAMVARVFEPGCKCDYMIVLEGDQGEEKSKLCRALAGDDYFSEHLPPIDGDPVRLSQHLRGKWLIEISELSAISKADAPALKSFISRREEKYTPKYGREEVTEPRQCLLIGTTNDDDYIKDDSGGRRYWPIKVIKIDIPAFRQARDQIFAEAVDAYRHSKPWWPDRAFEKKTIAPIQEERQFEDAWTEKSSERIASLKTTTIAEVAGMIGIDTTKLGTGEQRRIASILRKAKWEKVLDSATRRKAWTRPEPIRTHPNPSPPIKPFFTHPPSLAQDV